MHHLAQIDPIAFPTLQSAGVAVQRFEAYHHTELNPHSVNVVLLTCVISGCGMHQMGEQAIAVGPGSVGITHYGQSHDLLTGKDGMDVINVYVDLQSHELPIVPAPWDRPLAAILAPHPSLVHRQNRQMHLLFDEPVKMAQPLKWMLREQAAGKPARDAMMRSLLALFLVECCRVADQHQGQIQSEANMPPPWVEKVRIFIDDAFDRPLSLADMTRLAGVSEEHLCRKFKDHTALPPVAYLNNRRLQHAMWLLRTTDRTVTEIALASGFSQVSYFNRRFKVATGRTPTAFRCEEPGRKRK